MQDQQKQLVERLKQAQNILITVSTNPSVDQLAACIGLTLALNHLDKHATAVFSGKVPSTLEFLKPDETLEKNTDSLRDFIIALDKSKADKLRYKVEDNVVRIFITPYRTSISEKDLDFSQGDFNVDVVVGLGVREQQDLDTAITAHGRILHDATVATVNIESSGELGTLNWVNPDASSLSEMVVGLVDGLDKKIVDSQIATALLTGIVASTERFRNDKTSPATMSASAELMAAGANQQLIATRLETSVASTDSAGTAEPPDGGGAPTEPDPGTLEVNHDEPPTDETSPEPEPTPEPKHPQVHIDENGRLMTEGQAGGSLPDIGPVRGVSSEGRVTESDGPAEARERIIEPPAGNTPLTANTEPEDLDPSTEELTLPRVDSLPLLTHEDHVSPPEPGQPATPPQPELPPADLPPFTPDETLDQIERAVGSDHVSPPAGNRDVSAARDAVEAALNDPQAPPSPLEPITALNAQQMGPELHGASALGQSFGGTPAAPPPAPVNTGFNEPTPGSTPADDTLDMPLPGSPLGPPTAPPSAFPGTPQQPGSMQQPGSSNDGLPPPPPVPPPMLPPLQP